MRASLALAFAACGLLATVGDASAQTWTRSRGAFARYGLISEACFNDGHTSMCLALACRVGQLELVSVAGGGGPMEDETTIRFGGRSIRATFAFDDRAVDVMGLAAARARVSPEVLQAMTAAKTIELSAPNAGVVVVHRFGTSGFADELLRANAVCVRRPPRSRAVQPEAER